LSAPASPDAQVYGAHGDETGKILGQILRFENRLGRHVAFSPQRHFRRIRPNRKGRETATSCRDAGTL
jgi:hypothetical protein